MNIFALVNDPDVPPGRLLDLAAQHGHKVTVLALYAGAPLPSVDAVDAVVSLGGHMGAYDADEYPYLTEEKEFLAAAVAEGVPVLGLCLGGQLLADALGGRAYLADRPEIVYGAVECVDQDDPVGRALASGPVVRFHQDTWSTPDDAKVLATGGGFDQAFRKGSALAVQPHPEAAQSELQAWATKEESADMLSRAGVDGSALAAEVAASEAHLSALADRFFTAWFEEAGELSAARRRRR